MINKITLFLILILFSLTGLAKDEDKKKGKLAGHKYYRIMPDIVTNLQSKSRFQYGLFRIDLVTDSADKLKLIRHHKPLIVDRLILFINSHKRASLENTLKRMEFKTGALEVVQKTLKKETGKPLVQKMLFSRMVTEGG